jgi:hypothetical protein
MRRLCLDAVTPRLGAQRGRGGATHLPRITSIFLGFMGWAIVLEGRRDEAAILLLFDDRKEAEVIAAEVRRRGHPVTVRPYPDPGATAIAQALRSSTTPGANT